MRKVVTRSTSRTEPASATIGRLKGMLRALFYLVGMNIALQLPFWIAEHFYSFQRPLFNYDLALALLGFSVSAWIGWPLLCFALFIDVVRIASLNYHFQSFADFVESARFVGLLHIGGFVSWALIAALGCVLVYAGIMIRWLGHWRRSLVIAQFLFLFVLAALDSLNGSMQLFGQGLDRFRLPVNVAGSPTWNLYRMHAAGGSAAMALAPMPSAANVALRDWHVAHGEQSLMLVLVESMGAPKSATIRAWLANQIRADGVDARWNLMQGEERFHGPTTHGELRVLCALDGAYELVSKSTAPSCLPWQLTQDGFESVGYHGFQLTMFDRQRWWTALGLKAYQFDYENANSQVKDCHNVFHGICDAEVLREAVAHVQGERRFSYVMTLDTHLPLPSAASAVPEDVRALCAREDVSVSACELVNQLGATLRRLGGLLAAGRGTPFVAVVGDHAPPFLGRDSRAAFLPDKVPFFLLQPRSASPIQEATTTRAPSVR